MLLAVPVPLLHMRLVLWVGSTPPPPPESTGSALYARDSRGRDQINEKESRPPKREGCQPTNSSGPSPPVLSLGGPVYLPYGWAYGIPGGALVWYVRNLERQNVVQRKFGTNS